MFTVWSKTQIRIYFTILRCLLTIAIIAVCEPCLLHAEDNNQTTDILVSSNFHNSNVKYIQTLKDGVLSLKDKTKFKIKVKIEPVVESEKTIFTRKILNIDHREIKCIDTPCQKQWEFDLYKDDINLVDLPHLQLAWTQELKKNAPEISVSVFLQNKSESKNSDFDNSKGSRDSKNSANFKNSANLENPRNPKDSSNDDILVKGVFRNAKSSAIVETSTVNLDRAEYVEKSRLYLAKREFGFKEDKKWRYSMDGTNLVLQSRLDIPLKNARALKIYYKKGSKPVRVSLSIDKDGDMDRDLFIQFEQMAKREYREHGKNVLALDFSRALKNAGVDIKKGHLLEPIIFIHQDIGSYQRDKPLARIVFGIEENKADNIVSPKVKKAGKKIFLDFDFGNASGLDRFWNLKVKKIVINAEFKSPQIFSWDKIMFFDAYSQNVPSVLSQPELSLQKWIGSGISFAPYEYLTSFKPLLLKSFQNIEGEQAVKELTDEYKYPELKNSAFHDKNLEINVSDTWYNLKKDKGKININGIFAGKDSRIKIAVGDFSNPVFFQVQKKNIDYIIVKKIGNRTYNLPFKYLTGKRGIYLDRGEKLTLLLKNEINEIKESAGHDNGKNRTKIKKEKYKQWELALSVKEENASRLINAPIFDSCNTKTQTFIADDPVVNNQLLLIYHGNKPLKGNLDYFDTKGNKKSLLVFISKNEKEKYIDVAKGSKLLDFRVAKRFQSAYDISFIDFKTGSIDTSVDDKFDLSKLEWWDKKESIKLKPAGKGIKISKNGYTSILYKTGPDQNQWTFTLGNRNFFKLDNIKLDNDLPFGCSATLIVNGKIVDIASGDKNNNAKGVIDLQEYLPVKTIVYKINSHDNRKIFYIKTPEIDVTGIKHTAQEDAEHLKIKIGYKTIPMPLDLLDLLFKQHDYWISMGDIELGKGEHFIEAFNSKYFRIKSLMLETDTTLPFNSGDAGKKKQAPSLLTRLLMMGVKLILFAGFIFILYLFRKRIKSAINFAWTPVQKRFLKCYWFIPDEAWVALWFLGGAGLYGLGLLSKSRGENYAVTFAGIFMVVFLWHLGRLMKAWFLKQFPKIAIPVYRSSGSLFFAWAIVLLIVTALLVVAKLEPLAEQTAIVVYYCLVVGVVGEIKELKKSKKAGTESTQEYTTVLTNKG